MESAHMASVTLRQDHRLTSSLRDEEEAAMAKSKLVTRGVGKLSRSRTLGIAGLLLLLGTEPSWAGPPNPTPSDGFANTAGGTGALKNNTTGGLNSAFGSEALFNNGTGGGNSAFGTAALRSNNTGGRNSAFGVTALYSNTTGGRNSAFGGAALINNTTGNYNSAFGAEALKSNTTGGRNSAFGGAALFRNDTGDLNSAFGSEALSSNDTGNYNSAFGAEALRENTTGFDNSAFGLSALGSNTTGSVNSAFGLQALGENTTGYDNSAFGLDALRSNTTGVTNSAFGNQALYNNTTGSFNTAIGFRADANAGNYTNGTALGFDALLTASNSIVLGNNAISRIYANVTAITAISDRRRKKDIRALDADLGLDFIEKLKPVSYRFGNGDETERYGFIAQDLEQALPVSLHDIIERSEPEHGLALIERQNDKDRTYRVSYGELFAPIVKAIQQQQREIEAERQQNAELRHALEDQAATIKAENDALRHSIAALREQVIVAR
jgi:hypothetical protein